MIMAIIIMLLLLIIITTTTSVIAVILILNMYYRIAPIHYRYINDSHQGGGRKLAVLPFFPQFLPIWGVGRNPAST